MPRVNHNQHMDYNVRNDSSFWQDLLWLCSDPYEHKILFFVTAPCYLSASFLVASCCLEPEYSASARSAPMANVHWGCRTCSSCHSLPYVASCWKADWLGCVCLPLKSSQTVVYSPLHLCQCPSVQCHLFFFYDVENPGQKDISFKVVFDAAVKISGNSRFEMQLEINKSQLA